MLKPRKSSFGKRITIAGALVILSASYSHAQRGGQASLPTDPAGHPDMSGFWELRFDSRSVPLASLTPEYASDKTKAAIHDNDIESVRWCVPAGVPALMDSGAPLDLRQSPKVIGIVSKMQSSVRYIYTDGRPQPDIKETDPQTNGYSMGHWEGDTLVVDTTGFSDRGVLQIPGGGARTSSSHLVERYQLVQGGNRLHVTFTWTDSKVFQKPQTYEFLYYKVSENPMPHTFGCGAQDAARAAFLEKSLATPLPTKQ